jgi:hypothetical protein
MSNVDAVRASYAAFAAGDMDGVIAPMHPDIVWEQAQGLPHGGVYHGVDEVRRAVFDPLDDEWWDDFRADPDEFIEAGEHVVVLGRYTARAKGTGRPLDVPYLHLWTFNGPQAVRFRQFLDTHGWVTALHAV